jgi:hypothetical protein
MFIEAPDGYTRQQRDTADNMDGRYANCAGDPRILAPLGSQLKLHLRDGRNIGSIADAIALLREHEVRPGVDVRDEVLHKLERARTDQERQEAVHAFVVWARELGLL